MSENKILIVASHPDDEILGCGGTVARMVKEGAEAYTLLLGGGREQKEKSNYLNARKANDTIGSKLIDFISAGEDNQFDKLSLLYFAQIIETFVRGKQPNIIFTHYGHDLNIDHRITYQAVITATRPMPGNTVKEIYSFEIPSSTEWAFPTSFSPDVFWDIDSTLDNKIKALDCYGDELRPYPHPRSEEGIEYLAGYRGMQCGCEYAEAFKTVRVIR